PALSLVPGDERSRPAPVSFADAHGTLPYRGRRRASRGWLRAAAAVVLAVGGMAMGRATANVPLPVAAASGEQGDARRVTGGAHRTSPRQMAAARGAQGSAERVTGRATCAAGASLAANPAGGADSIMSTDDALAMMRRAESEYRLAAAYIAAFDTTGGSDVW